jgi:hypothetical protein
MGDGRLSVFPSKRTDTTAGWSVYSGGISILLLILLGLWHFADETVLPAIALAMLALALAAFCPEQP